jgi:hypothetical protein
VAEEEAEEDLLGWDGEVLEDLHWIQLGVQCSSTLQHPPLR